MFKNLQNKSESYRKKAALLTTVGLFSIIFISWAAYRGMISLPETIAFESDISNEKNLGAIEAASPFESISAAFGSVFTELKSEYRALQESVSDVFVPFITGIEVYESR